MSQLPRILIVEDNADHCVILRRHLQRLGQFEILDVSDGAQAVALAREAGVDLIMLDLRLPGLDGWEVTRRIRALPPPQGQVPIVAHTAYATPEVERRTLAAGCTAYLVKPIMDWAAVALLFWQLLG